jgi:DNA-binding transcriptional ArsR family regulator
MENIPTGRQIKDQLYGGLARLTEALASPRRLELLELLLQGPSTVESLAERSGQGLTSASQHLKQLREARLVEVSPQGQRRVYRVATPQVEAVFLALRGLAQARLAELEALERAHLRDLGAPAEPAPAELLQRALAGELLILDVRPRDEFEAGHLPGARCLPLEELEAALSGLPPGRELLACCRGPWCFYALEAVQRLRAAGWVAHRLELGPPDWRAAGLILELGP